MGQTTPSPRLSANFLSRLFFWWLKPLFYQGKARDLKNDDLHDALPADVSEHLGGRLEKYWKNEVENARQSDRKPKLVNAIRKAFGWSYFYYAGHMLVLNCLRVLQPFILGLLIQYFKQDSDVTKEHAYGYASILVLLTFVHSLLKHHIDLGTLEIGMRLRIACSSLIYRKVLRLSNASVTTTTGGQVINLLSNDVVRFDPLFMYLHYVWITPIAGAVITYLIWCNAKVAALVGVLLMTLETVPVQVYAGKIASKLRSKIATRTDERVRLMGEIINGIHVIKMYTWEKPFEFLVSLARRYEIDVITLMSYLKGVNIASNAFVDRTCLYFTIMAYVLAGNFISADKVFSMVQYFTILQGLLAYNYPRAMFSVAETRVSIKRIEKFLMLDEIKIRAPLLSIEDNGSIILKSVTGSWSPNLIVNTLHDITLYISPKKLHTIVGPIGSGKTSLIHLILGELRWSSGDVKINGTTSYAGQRPWLFPGTVRDNVVFDQPYDEERFREVVRVCSLERDLQRLSHAERTQVGERGTNLSGGQCARVNLARAVYKDADIYIFDDPFSAVDANVCKYIFNECINGYLKEKTKILVTHQVQCLKEADTVFLLNNGKLEFQGKFVDFPRKELQFLHLIEDKNDEETYEVDEVTLDIESRNNITNTDLNNIIASHSKFTEDNDPQETEELIAKGKMQSSIFTRYFHSGNPYSLLLTTILFFIIAQIIRSGSDYWLAYWTHQDELRFNTAVINRGKNTIEIPLLNLTAAPVSSLKSTTQSILNETQPFMIDITTSLPTSVLSQTTTTSSSTTSTLLSTTVMPITTSFLDTIQDLVFNTLKTLLPNTTTSLPSSELDFILSKTNSTSTTTVRTLVSSTIGSLVLNVTNSLPLDSTENSSSALQNLMSNAINSISSTTTVTILVSNTTENLVSHIPDSFSLDSIESSTSMPQNFLSDTSPNTLLNVTEILSKVAERQVSDLIANETYNVKPNIEKTNYLSTNVALVIYGCILLGCIITTVSKCLLFYKVCMNSSKSIHNEMFSCVLGAPMHFFNQQSSGQILNRFSKDIGTMDEILPVTMYESIEVFCIIVGIIVQNIIVNWWSILPMIVTGFLYWKIRGFYVPTAYGIKRLEGAAKSPVFSYISASLDGLATIRSCRAQTTVSRRFDSRQDAHTRTHFLGIVISSAFGLWLDLVSVVLVGFVTFGCLIVDPSTIYAGSAGLAITQVLMLCGMLQRGIRQTAESITQMTSVERILQYTKLEQEEDSNAVAGSGTKPASNWPMHGKVEFKEFCLRYIDDEEPILKNVNLVIEPGSKLGIVGRTGAGKSSLISALFRLARAEGQVLIDGVDTRSVGLNELRKRLAIIPQEPVLFSTSLRDNLDPFHDFEDTRLWAALEDVELHKAFVPLDHPIECGGRNLRSKATSLPCTSDSQKDANSDSRRGDS
ncbi:ATP-binding cassette subfamily C member 4-like isoform X2 [Phymastichus coffea]|uniref:ATP-binding cassette subfamily C member 4-like isoform X2 n=1 Tax=Phymastichus coffea TaxID=108790 RepID=UPI00273AC442|nr:ATP-binding cassette subfamily C member 4-like isoform X2 [Phymastichus coffea]